MDVNLKIPALEKLLDIVASGIGSVAGPMLGPWRAKQQAEAMKILAEGEANALQIQAEAQSKARSILLSGDVEVSGELNITNMIDQRIQFQELKRQTNIHSVVSKAAHQLGDKIVPNSEPDHDWTARFFNDVQDVSTEEMQMLWAKVLAGEVEQTGSTSIRTLGILKNLDQATAKLFSSFCSACVFIYVNSSHGWEIYDARVPSLGGSAGNNCLADYGFGFNALNILNEHGLIIGDYNSWINYQDAVGTATENSTINVGTTFQFENRWWILVPTSKRDSNEQFKIHGVALTKSGMELSRVVDFEPVEKFAEELTGFFLNQQFEMKDVGKWLPRDFVSDLNSRLVP